MDDDRDGGQQRGYFGRLLLRYRSRTGLTQRELASCVGVAMRSVQGWETGLMYPGAGHLEALLACLLEAGGFSPGAELAQAEAVWAAVEREAPRTHPQFPQEQFSALLAQRTHAMPSAQTTQRSPGAHPQTASDSRQDWGDAPTVVDFVGRTAELTLARQWVLEERCRLLGVLGMGGIGKTSVAARIAQDVAPAFGHVYWRSLRNAPPVAEWMAGAISFLSGQQQTAPAGAANQLTALLRLLRERSSLLVLDNFETVLEPGQLEGRYREMLQGYGDVLQTVGETSHQSCVVITSREAPPDWTLLGSGGVRTLELGGLGAQEGQALLAHKQLRGGEDEWADLVDRYGGNGLALKVVGESIRQVFGGDIGSFLAESRSGAVFGGIRRLLAEQFERSSLLEQAVLKVLAVEREPVTIAELLGEMGQRVGRGGLVESVEALRQRSLVERAELAGASAFTLQSVVLEYVTDRLVSEVREEIMQGSPAQLVAQPLVKAQAREYVRQSQERLIGEPIIHQLEVQHGVEGAESLLLGLLDVWRYRPQSEQGFGPGNAVNLLRLLRGNLRGADMAHLVLRQAYLAGIEAQDASMVNTDLSQASLTETFNYPLAVSLSADGALLAAGTAGGEVCLWHVADRTPLLMLQAHAGPVHRVALSEDGHLLASASEDGTIRLWRAPEGQALAVLSGHTSPVYAMVLSSDSALLVSGSFDGSINLWDVQTHQLLATLQAHATPVWTVSLTADARVLASGSFDGSIRLWDVASRQLMTTLDGEGSPVWSLRLSADGSLLASGTEDGQVRLWDGLTYQLLNTLREHNGSVRGVAFSVDGGILASASWDSTVRLWDPADGRPVAVLEGHTGPVRSVALSADGRIVASASLDGSVRLWEAPTARPLARLAGHTSPVYGVALNDDGTLLASGSWNGTVELWDTTGGRKRATLSGHSSPVYSVALSSDGQLVASASWDRSLRVWQTSTGQLVATLRGHIGGVRSAALSVEGDLLVSGSWDGTVRLWRTRDGEPIALLRGHDGPVRTVALSADGRIVVSGGLDGTVRLWQTSDGTELATLEDATSPVYCVALSDSGEIVASGGWDGMLRIWDAGRRQILALEGHAGEVRGIALSRDGSLLASGGFDAKVRLWDVPSGRLRATLDGHTSAVYGVAMTPNGRLAVSGSFDGTLRMWEVSSGACLRVLRSDRPYERMDITHLSGVTEAQRAALITLGALDHSVSADAVHSGTVG
jgi:WD40 repeat protein/transcriptional regulator with XRE-family HTH domain